MMALGFWSLRLRGLLEIFVGFCVEGSLTLCLSGLTARYEFVWCLYDLALCGLRYPPQGVHVKRIPRLSHRTEAAYQKQGILA